MAAKRLTLDRLASVSADRIGPAAYTLLDAMQDFRPEEQAAGYGLAFLVMCRNLNCHPGDALQVAERILESAGEYVPEIRAMRKYLENEL